MIAKRKLIPERMRQWLTLLVIPLTFLIVSCSETEPGAPVSLPDSQVSHAIEDRSRAPDVPELPFPDNPDPDQCGIPTRWGLDEPAWLVGEYEGELVQPTVYLYDSHLRFEVMGAAPSGTSVKVILYQSNPVLDYYFVRTLDTSRTQEGWVPAPFLRFEPPNKT